MTFDAADKVQARILKGEKVHLRLFAKGTKEGLVPDMELDLTTWIKQDKYLSGVVTWWFVKAMRKKAVSRPLKVMELGDWLRNNDWREIDAK